MQYSLLNGKRTTAGSWAAWCKRSWSQTPQWTCHTLLMIKAFNPCEPIRNPQSQLVWLPDREREGERIERERERERGSASETAKPWEKASDEQESVWDKKQTFYWLWNIKDKRIKNIPFPVVREICETTKEVGKRECQHTALCGAHLDESHRQVKFRYWMSKGVYFLFLGLLPLSKGLIWKIKLEFKCTRRKQINPSKKISNRDVVKNTPAHALLVSFY